MKTINQEYFDRPESQQLAAGATIDRISPEATAAARARSGLKAEILLKIPSNGGIENPVPITIPTGVSLIRFSSGPFVDKLAGGEWWLDMDANRLVERYADQQSLSIQDSLRRLCAVPAEWNIMTLKVQFMTLAPLSAYAGPGKDAFYEDEKGYVRRQKVEMIDGQKVKQLFIPGLSDPDLCRRALLDRGSLHMPKLPPR